MRGICPPLAPLLALALVLGVSILTAAPMGHPAGTDRIGDFVVPATSNNSAVANFTAAINRIVVLLGLAGSGLLAVVWARVALSWFSNDLTKKIQAKDRARDALIGTLIFTAAITGLAWGLANWVITGV
jgi:hypothetical protein